MATATHEPHSEVLAHHFDNLEQQRRAARLGMWLFLVTEVLFFGGVFAAYAAYRLWYPVEFAAASSRLNVLIAGINSVILLTSSLTITLAIHASQRGRKAAMVGLLALTAALGIAFLGFKAVEYTADVYEKLVPGTTTMFDSQVWIEQDISPARIKLFLMFYYTMTGLHVVHLAVGIGLVIWLTILAARDMIPPERYMLVEITSLYWHFVDLVWLFLMPLLYLAGTHDPSQLTIWPTGGHHGSH